MLCFLNSSKNRSSTRIRKNKPKSKAPMFLHGRLFFLSYLLYNLFVTMDIISHILIGKIVSFFDRKTKRAGFWTILFSFFPDLFQLPAYIYLGYINNRFFLIPKNIDWDHARNLYPLLHAFTWEIPHSIFFLFLIIFPAVLYFKLPKIAFFAYFLHIIIDIPSHAGEWAIKPFYPINYTINGFANAWAWPFKTFFYSWIFLVLIIILLSFFFRKKKKHADASDSN